MNKKTLLKSIIGTVGIYLVLIAFIFIFRDIVDFLVHFSILVGAFVACSIAAGLLFKGKIYVWVWTAASIIFMFVFSGGNLEFILMGVWYILAPLAVPFLIIKSIFISKIDELEHPVKVETAEKETRSD